MTSVSTRHTQQPSGDVFVSCATPPEGTVEVVCNSSRRRMDHNAKYTSYRLFSHTVSLDRAPMCSWPERTDLHCWNCCHPFDSVPVSIPRSTAMVDQRSYYEVYGVFCSLNCAKKHLLEQHSHDQQDLLMRLNELCVNVYGLDPESVFNAKEAPPRIFLKMFGGHLDIAAYREKSVHVRTVLMTPPFVSHAMVLEEHSTTRETSDTPVVEALREGQHELRGLRRPTHPLQTGNPAPAAESKFDAYMKTRETEAKPAPRPTKRQRKQPVAKGGGLTSFLKSAS